MKKTLSAVPGALCALGLAVLALPALAQQPLIHRCIEDGQPVYQQDACPGGGERLVPDRRGELVPLPPEPARPPRPAASAPAAAAPSAPARPRPQPAASRPLSAAELRAEAEACLEWYRAMLPDPHTAYSSRPRKEGRELIMMIHAPDGQGGFRGRVASCGFEAGRLDAAETQAHAQRRGWTTAARR
ncbi:hypothetical protein [Caldimonas tepidiphila]|uniref:hypothetical protein n=1 Tax=Caldimonas tepidiphila TaxID=2315841 RepID=UPI000E5B3427|nr:hypothetical protein [Caldimonas tepidiphila]